MYIWVLVGKSHVQMYVRICVGAGEQFPLRQCLSLAWSSPIGLDYPFREP